MREDNGGSLRDQADPGRQECHKLDIVAKIRAANATRESYLPWSEYEAAADEIERLRTEKDNAYEERNRVVALLATLYPSGIARTDIPGWMEGWHGCVYIDLPTGQASWHYHESQAYLFERLPPYSGKWDGHTTAEKYKRIRALSNCPAPAGKGLPASAEGGSHPSLASAASGMRDALEKADESLLLMTMYAKAYINTAGTTLRQDAWNLAQERINEAEDARAAIAAALSKES